MYWSWAGLYWGNEGDTGPGLGYTGGTGIILGPGWATGGNRDHVETGLGHTGGMGVILVLDWAILE